MHMNETETGPEYLTGHALLWSTAIQLFCAVFLLITVIHTYRSAQSHFGHRIHVLNWKIQQMEQRLRLQEPNYNVLAAIAAKMRISVEEVDGERTKRMEIWTSGNAEQDPLLGTVDARVAEKSLAKTQ